ncbi:MAG: PH domain-containing protein [Bryobacteraceae bacterium]
MAEQAKEHFQLGEHALQAVGGAYECKRLGQDSLRVGVLIATDRRVFFFAKKLFGYETEEIPYPNISSIEFSKGALLGYRISLFTSGNSAQ